MRGTEKAILAVAVRAPTTLAEVGSAGLGSVGLGPAGLGPVERVPGLGAALAEVRVVCEVRDARLGADGGRFPRLASLSVASLPAFACRCLSLAAAACSSASASTRACSSANSSIRKEPATKALWAGGVRLGEVDVGDEVCSGARSDNGRCPPASMPRTAMPRVTPRCWLIVSLIVPSTRDSTPMSSSRDPIPHASSRVCPRSSRPGG